MPRGKGGGWLLAGFPGTSGLQFRPPDYTGFCGYALCHGDYSLSLVGTRRSRDLKSNREWKWSVEFLTNSR